MDMLTQHFSYDEMVASQTASRLGIDNTPAAEVRANLLRTAQLLELVCGVLLLPIVISSGYRSVAVNEAVGGVATSAHCQGYAADFICPRFGTPFDVCNAIAASNIRFDQLIHEFGAWCHISCDPRMRGEKLTILHDSKGYRPGILR